MCGGGGTCLLSTALKCWHSGEVGLGDKRCTPPLPSWQPQRTWQALLVRWQEEGAGPGVGQGGNLGMCLGPYRGCVRVAELGLPVGWGVSRPVSPRLMGVHGAWGGTMMVSTDRPWAFSSPRHRAHSHRLHPCQARAGHPGGEHPPASLSRVCVTLADPYKQMGEQRAGHGWKRRGPTSGDQGHFREPPSHAVLCQTPRSL